MEEDATEEHAARRRKPQRSTVALLDIYAGNSRAVSGIFPTNDRPKRFHI
jgi:hypothetical protein